VSLNVHNDQFKGISLEPSISASGRYVLFAMTRDGDGLANLYVRDRKAHTTRILFNEAKHGHAIGGSWQLSANGCYVAFMTDGALVPEDTNGEFDAYRIDVATGALVRAFVTSDGAQAGGVTGRVAISGDGNRVGFSTTAAGYTPGDSGGISDVFVRDSARHRRSRSRSTRSATRATITRASRATWVCPATAGPCPSSRAPAIWSPRTPTTGRTSSSGVRGSSPEAARGVVR
jgi:Tol biopolymer transport system component